MTEQELRVKSIELAKTCEGVNVINLIVSASEIEEYIKNGLEKK